MKVYARNKKWKDIYLILKRQNFGDDGCLEL